VSTKAPIEFAENPQPPGSATTSRTKTPLGSNMELMSERKLDEVGDVNEDDHGNGEYYYF
jgi:hypothetical protein